MNKKVFFQSDLWSLDMKLLFLFNLWVRQLFIFLIHLWAAFGNSPRHVINLLYCAHCIDFWYKYYYYFSQMISLRSRSVITRIANIVLFHLLAFLTVKTLIKYNKQNYTIKCNISWSSDKLWKETELQNKHKNYVFKCCINHCI